jgi:hypothetical protein
VKERPILFSGPMVRAILDGRKTQTRRLMKPQPVGRAGVVWPAEDRWEWSCSAGRTMLDEREAPCCCPHGYERDRLWVRETHALDGQRVAYDADGWCGAICDDGGGGKVRIPHGRIVDARTSERGPWPDGGARSFGLAGYGGRWRPSIHMPRWASRILLEITEVRVQPLQDLTEADAKAEGVKPFGEAFAGISLDQRIASTTLADRERGAPDRDFRAGDSPYRASFACLWDEINGDRATWASNPWVWAIAFRRVDATRSA